MFTVMLGLGAVAAVCVGLFYLVTGTKGSSQHAVDKTISQSGMVQMKSNGKLKLFDSHSTLLW